MPNCDVIRVAAVVLRDEGGRILTVRKRGTSRFMFPGGKPEPGETFAETAVRECVEELGVHLDADMLRLIGVFTAPAANEEGYECEETLFEHPAVLANGPNREIEELRWLDPTAPLSDDLAPLLAKIVPLLPNRRSLRNVTFYAGSAAGNDPLHAQAVEEIATEFAERGLGIVYGGGKVGLMGVLADTALAASGRVTGVIPQALVDGELAHPGLTRLEITSDMAERKAMMGDLGDAFVALPGGSGTLEEFFETWTWQQLGFRSKPVALYNIGGFWDPLIAAIRSIVNTGFLSEKFSNNLIIADTPLDLIEAFSTWQPPASKW